MARKDKVLEELKDKGYSYQEVKHIIGTITEVEPRQVSKLKRGDVFLITGSGNNVKRRPAVIIKTTDCLVHAIPLSTTEDCLNLHTYKSRFFGEGYFSNQLISVKLEYVYDNFAGILDAPKDLKTAIEKLKNVVENL